MGAKPVKIVTPKNRKLAFILFIGPFIGLYTIIALAIVTGILTLTNALYYSPIITLFIGVFITLGALSLLSFAICIPYSIIYINKLENSLEKFDPRSGNGKLSKIPEGIKKWNWGAAGLGSVWGFYHRTWLAFF